MEFDFTAPVGVALLCNNFYLEGNSLRPRIKLQAQIHRVAVVFYLFPDLLLSPPSYVAILIARRFNTIF